MSRNGTLIDIELPKLPAKWDYDVSVKRTKQLTHKWKTMSVAMLSELWIAREKLSQQGQRTDLTSEQKFRGWSDYCRDIGSSRQVVNRWLSAYIGKSSIAKSDKSRKTPTLEKQTADVHQGDFRDVLADVTDVDLILTDPPYGREYLDLWRDLGSWAAEALSPTGILIAYSGQMYLPDVLAYLSESLTYWWCAAVVHAGSGNLTPLGHPCRKVINKWKPIVMFIRNDGEGFSDTFFDLLMGLGKQKDDHNWQQNEHEAAVLIEKYSRPGDKVVDPFAGSGCFVRKAAELGRVAIGAEILTDDDEDANG